MATSVDGGPGRAFRSPAIIWRSLFWDVHAECVFHRLIRVGGSRINCLYGEVGKEMLLAVRVVTIIHLRHFIQQHYSEVSDLSL